MSEPLLTWDKPLTSKQASRYLLTNGFVAVELYRAEMAECEKRKTYIIHLLKKQAIVMGLNKQDIKWLESFGIVDPDIAADAAGATE